MIRKIRPAMLVAGLLAMSTAAYADTVGVPGTANPFYAGRSDTGGDGTVPPQSSLVLIPGATLTFSATGGAGYTPDNCCFPIDGDGGAYIMDELDSTTGIAGIDNGPAAALIGLLLNDKTPKPPAPTRLDFSVIGLDFAKLKPHLKQMFFIGDGREGSDAGKRQKFIVPKGATRLFLAVSDGSGWYDNSGEIDATVTQTPAK